MNTLSIVIAGVFAAAFVAALVLNKQSVYARVTLTILALGFAAFCAFGFLASYELAPSARWPWQLGYGILGISSVAGAALVFLKGRAQRQA